MTPVTRIRELAERTGPDRLRSLDLLRALAISAVVLGHWLIMTVDHDPRGRLTGTSALGELTWSHPLTWLFQVMPVFFMVGGFANAISLSSHRRRGGDDYRWLLSRSARLVRPTTVLLVVLAGGAVLARVLGADPVLVGRAVWLASLPLWFLVAYLVMVALTPVMYRWHERAGLAVPVLLLVPVVVGDVLRLQLDNEVWAYGNFLFGWLAIHQLGFVWRDGRLPDRRPVALALLLGGLAALVLLTVAGPYPVSMVTVPGAALQNASPPSLALVALAVTQLGLAMLLRAPTERWLRRRRPWLAVVGANSVILTVFLWHMSAAVLVTVILHAAGRLPTPAVDSADWLLWQIPWVAMLAVMLAGLVAIFGRVETRAAAGSGGGGGRAKEWPGGGGGRAKEWPGRPPARWAARLVPVGFAAVVLGLLWQAVAGSDYHGPFGMPTGALLLYLAGALYLRLVG